LWVSCVGGRRYFPYYSYRRNPTGREFFVPARTQIAVKLLVKIPTAPANGHFEFFYAKSVFAVAHCVFCVLACFAKTLLCFHLLGLFIGIRENLLFQGYIQKSFLVIGDYKKIWNRAKIFFLCGLSRGVIIFSLDFIFLV
jgi:hypothetical protein